MALLNKSHHQQLIPTWYQNAICIWTHHPDEKLSHLACVFTHSHFNGFSSFTLRLDLCPPDADGSPWRPHEGRGSSSAVVRVRLPDMCGLVNLLLGGRARL